MKKLILAAALLSACSSNTTYKVAGFSLSVADTGYVSTDGHGFCPAAAAGQLKVVLVDYHPICGPSVGIDADGGARDNQLEHNELTLLFINGVQTDPAMKFAVSVPNCDIGPAGPAIAYFDHFASHNAVPQRTFATGGSMMLTYVDPAGAKPAKGSFDLVFPTGKVAGDFNTYTCN